MRVKHTQSDQIGLCFKIRSNGKAMGSGGSERLDETNLTESDFSKIQKEAE